MYDMIWWWVVIIFITLCWFYCWCISGPVPQVLGSMNSRTVVRCEFYCGGLRRFSCYWAVCLPVMCCG